jgi:hypothetical protein
MLIARRVIPPLVAAAAVILLLAGCHPGTAASTKAPKAGASSGAGAGPTVSATPKAAAPVAASAADYLLDGTPYQPDSNGEWDGHYGFWTDASHAVACDIFIFSGDSGGVSCEIRAAFASQRSYSLPAGVTTTCSPTASGGYNTDGSALDINYKIFNTANANPNVGWAGCIAYQDTSFDAKRKVLQPNSILTVTQQGFETYTCQVAASVAACSDSTPGSSFHFGLKQADFHQG